MFRAVTVTEAYTKQPAATKANRWEPSSHEHLSCNALTHFLQTQHRMLVVCVLQSPCRTIWPRQLDWEMSASCEVAGVSYLLFSISIICSHTSTAAICLGVSLHFAFALARISFGFGRGLVSFPRRPAAAACLKAFLKAT